MSPLSPSQKFNSKIYFFFQDVKVSLSDRTRLKRYISSICEKERRKIDSLNYIFCNDEDLLQINKIYLKHRFYTDVITFDLSESVSIQAEIYISIDRVRDNARVLGVSIKSELHRVIFHGVLHLCGYKDKSKLEKEKIRMKEDFYLSRYLR